MTLKGSNTSYVCCFFFLFFCFFLPDFFSTTLFFFLSFTVFPDLDSVVKTLQPMTCSICMITKRNVKSIYHCIIKKGFFSSAMFTTLYSIGLNAQMSFSPIRSCLLMHTEAGGRRSVCRPVMLNFCFQKKRGGGGGGRWGGGGG